jgi:hypothetical protein
MGVILSRCPYPYSYAGVGLSELPCRSGRGSTVWRGLNLMTASGRLAAVLKPGSEGQSLATSGRCCSHTPKPGLRPQRGHA